MRTDSSRYSDKRPSRRAAFAELGLYAFMVAFVIWNWW